MIMVRLCCQIYWYGEHVKMLNELYVSYLLSLFLKLQYWLKMFFLLHIAMATGLLHVKCFGSGWSYMNMYACILLAQNTVYDSSLGCQRWMVKPFQRNFIFLMKDFFLYSIFTGKKYMPYYKHSFVVRNKCLYMI